MANYLGEGTVAPEALDDDTVEGLVDLFRRYRTDEP